MQAEILQLILMRALKLLEKFCENTVWIRRVSSGFSLAQKRMRSAFGAQAGNATDRGEQRTNRCGRRCVLPGRRPAVPA